MTRNSTLRKPIANPDLPSPPSGKYPAKTHARRVAKWIAENGGPSSGVIYLEGQSTKMKEVCLFHVVIQYTKFSSRSRTVAYIVLRTMTKRRISGETIAISDKKKNRLFHCCFLVFQLQVFTQEYAKRFTV